MGVRRRALSAAVPEPLPHSPPSAPTKVVVELSLTEPLARGTRVDATARGSSLEPSLGDLCHLLDHAGLIPGHLVGRASDRRTLPYGLRVRAIRFPPKHHERHEGIPDESGPARSSTAPPERLSRPSPRVPFVGPLPRGIPTLPSDHELLARAHHR